MRQGMAEDATVAEGGPGRGDSPGSSDARCQREGLLSWLWRALFRGEGEDYEKKLQCLSKEEASVQARMRRRARRGHKMGGTIIVFSVALEVVAVVCAIVAARSAALRWQIRAAHVLPIFVLPALSSAIYSLFRTLTSMLDLKDQKTLDRLRAERQEKIDELKERTNYYTTQQLIQRYDLDPAAKAAAATVLASKLGADTGLKVYVGDSSELDTLQGKSSGASPIRSDGLRSRKLAVTSDHQSTEHEMMRQLVRETSPDTRTDDHDVSPHTQSAIEHKNRSWGTRDDGGGWIARIAAMLVGEDPSQCYAIICRSCHMHNGLARKEDFPYITYYCPHCHALNGSRQAEEQDLGYYCSGEVTPSAAPGHNGVAAPEADQGGGSISAVAGV